MFVGKMKQQHNNESSNDMLRNFVNYLNKCLLHSGRQAWHVHPAPVYREDCAQPCNPKKHHP